ncbi:MAG: NAD(P)-dependent oxidoreductase [Geminicoccaceae bacterium]
MIVGLVGVGKMGRAVAERLVEQGHELLLWNRTAAKTEGIAGATPCPTPAELAAGADVVLSILANDEAIAAVYSGPVGLCSADLNGTTIVEMCTTSPERAIALEAEVRQCGGRFLECPVGGTIGPARAGQLMGLAGGSEGAFAAAKPVLEDMTRRLEHLGPVGTGAAMKLAINLPLMVYWAAVGEAIAIATEQGVEPELALDILADSSGAIGAAKKRLPPIHAMLEHASPGGTNFSLANGVKDMKLMEAALAERGIPSEVVSAARLKAEAAANGGWSDHDVSLFGIFHQVAAKD